MAGLKRTATETAQHQKKWFGKWHTWAGITSGFILIIVCLSGSLLVFEEELDVWLNPELFTFTEGGEMLSFEELTEAVQKQRPEAKLKGIFLQENRNNAVVFYIEGERREQIIANPYTGQVTGTRVYDKAAMGIIRNLHRTLLIPEIGRYIVGLASLMCVVLMITGLRLWIPKRWKNLKDRLSVRWKAKAKRVNYDLHNSLGFYLSPVITLVSLTGVMITFSNVILIFLFLLNFQAPQSLSAVFDQRSEYQEGTAPISVNEVVGIIKKRMPEAVVTGMSFPRDSVGVYNVNTTEPAAVQTGDRSIVFIDQYSGATVFTSDTKDLQLGKVYLNWVTPLHYGTFGGLPTRILALIASLVTGFLFVSGFIIWLPRWKKRKNRTSKPKAKKQEEPLSQPIDSVAV